jgi:hypothetical protein
MIILVPAIMYLALVIQIDNLGINQIDCSLLSLIPGQSRFCSYTNMPADAWQDMTKLKRTA